MKKLISFLLLFGFSSSSCEPDDICDPNTSTTPRMLIQFYDVSNPSILKNVTNLKIIGEGMTEGVILNPEGIGQNKYITNGNNILLPLKTNADIVNYTFILNYGNTNPTLTNEDNLQFNYTRENSYVSRACGYKTIFNLVPSGSFTLSDKTTPDGFWIKYILVVQSNITYENETIVKIFY